MEFTKNDYCAKVSALRDMVEYAGKDHIADIEEGFTAVETSMDGVKDMEGSILRLTICENQMEELLRGRHWLTLRRSNTYTIRSWAIYLYPDGEKMTCEDGTPECYRETVRTWMRAYIRNQAGGGSEAMEEVNDGM
jgi:hypothetical protein